jgi:hypothetical protein
MNTTTTNNYDTDPRTGYRYDGTDYASGVNGAANGTDAYISANDVLGSTVLNPAPASLRRTMIGPTTERPMANPYASAAAPADAPTGPRIDQVRYWVGAGITAVIAALASLVALVIAQGIVHVPVVLGSGTSLTNVHAAVYGLVAAAISLLAAALFDAMLHVAPRPLTYYSWLGAIVTVLAALLPFTTTAGLHSQIALAATNFVVGMIITLLVPVAASNARRLGNA